MTDHLRHCARVREMLLTDLQSKSGLLDLREVTSIPLRLTCRGNCYKEAKESKYKLFLSIEAKVKYY